MTRMAVAEFRIPDDLRAQVQEQADRGGVSFSEYVRQSLYIRLAWTAAIDHVQAGVHPAHLTDLEWVARHLRAISQAEPPDAPETHPPAPPQALPPA